MIVISIYCISLHMFRIRAIYGPRVSYFRFIYCRKYGDAEFSLVISITYYFGHWRSLASLLRHNAFYGIHDYRLCIDELRRQSLAALFDIWIIAEGSLLRIIVGPVYKDGFDYFHRRISFYRCAQWGGCFHYFWLMTRAHSASTLFFRRFPSICFLISALPLLAHFGFCWLPAAVVSDSPGVPQHFMSEFRFHSFLASY